MDPRSLCDLAIMLFSLGRALRPPLWKSCIRCTNYRRLKNCLEKKPTRSPSDHTEQINLTNWSNWLITGRTPFKSDTHFSAKLANSFKGHSCNVPLINNCSLKSDDFYLDQSVVSTTNIFRTILTRTILLHDWQLSETKTKSGPKVYWLNWKFIRNFNSRKEVFVIHTRIKNLVKCHLRLSPLFLCHLLSSVSVWKYYMF